MIYTEFLIKVSVLTYQQAAFSRPSTVQDISYMLLQLEIKVKKFEQNQNKAKHKSPTTSQNYSAREEKKRQFQIHNLN